MPEVLVLGLGNPVLGDDSVGWHVATQVTPMLADLPCDVDFLAVGGLGLMERLVGYRKVVLVDAIMSGERQPGEISVFPLEALPDLTAGHLTSIHDTSLPAALRLGHKLGVSLPEQIIVVGIEAQRIYDFTESLTPPVAAAVPEAARCVIEWVSRFLKED